VKFPKFTFRAETSNVAFNWFWRPKFDLKTDWKSSFSLTVRWGVSILSVSVRRGQ